ncbi:MAG TPA: AIR synthase related protein, partial [Longimicrobiales bacterium]|nr:AIR synthase related protein [Longimicrobiales bacterium]
LEKWELEAAVIGHVTDDGLYRVRECDRVVAEVPGESIVECPTYTREGVESEEVRQLRTWDPQELETGPDSVRHADHLVRLMGSPNIASKAWIYEQYDSTVRTNTVQPPGGDAGVLRVRSTSRGIAATVDCNPRYVYLNPRRGGMIAVAEAARNLVCVGARPRAVTDNLNFGNPHKPDVYFQMKESTEGIGEACRVLETPVVSGNVSLYNENPRGAIYPTPVIGMVGVLEDVSKTIGAGFRQKGHAVVLLGRNTAELGASEYLKVIHDRVAGEVPAVDLEAEKSLREAVLSMVDERLLASAHDCAEGGLAVSLAESCVNAAPVRENGASTDAASIGGSVTPGGAALGFSGRLEDDLPVDALLFGEAQGRIVVSCQEAAVERVMTVAAEHGVPAARIGTVMAAADGFRLDLTAAGVDIEVSVGDLAEVYRQAIPSAMEAPTTSD